MAKCGGKDLNGNKRCHWACFLVIYVFELSAHILYGFKERPIKGDSRDINLRVVLKIHILGIDFCPWFLKF